MEEAIRLSNNGTKELLVIAQDSTSYGWDLDNDTNRNTFSRLGDMSDYCKQHQKGLNYGRIDREL